MSGHEQYQELVEQLKRIPISEIYSRYIGGQLKRRGSKAVAHCPFHGGDDSPSLTLYLDKNNWYCYGCQRGGTVIDLVMSALGVNFKTAVTAAAGDFGFSLDSNRPLPPKKRRELRECKEKRDINIGFAADFDRVFSLLVSRKWELEAKLKTYDGFVNNIDLVHELPLLDGVMDEFTAARSEQDKLEAWRIARRVFPWIKTKTSASS